MTEAYVASLTTQDRSLLEVLPCYVLFQRGGDIVYANLVAREVLGLDAGATVPVEDIFEGSFPGLTYGRGGSSEPLRKNVLGSANQPYTSEFACRLRIAGGASSPVHGSFRMLQVEPEVELLIVAMPATAASIVGESSNFLEQILNAAPEAIMITRGARILHVNREFEKLFGFAAEDAVGRNTFDLLIPETRRHEFDMLEHTIQLYGRASMETVRLSKAGQLIDVSVLVAPIELSGVTVGNFVSYRDIRDKKQADSKLQHDALHDPLTGLANRTLFLDRLQLTMARQQRRSQMNFAVMFLDLDRFKAINDNLGHATGDELLVQLSLRLRACFRPEDTVARFGGDEFAILIADIAGAADVVSIAERVQRDIQLPAEIFGHEILISASIGTAFGTLDHTAAEQVLRDADFAMYQAKSRGNGRHEIFDTSMHVHVAERLQKEQDLKTALEKGEFEVKYRPIFRLQSGEVEGFEALLHWRRSDSSSVSFEEFLPEAEESGLSVPIGFFVLEEVTRQLRAWTEEMPGRTPTVSVALSPRQFKHPQLLERIAELLAQAQIPHGRLRLEIAESAIHEDPEAAITIVQRMVDMGLTIALDNFGIGLASMQHFIRLPIDVVKVDRRLIASLPVPGRQAAILQTFFDLGRLLQVCMLAEGIERREQMDALRKFRCDLVEGPLFSSVLSPENARAVLIEGHWPQSLA